VSQEFKGFIVKLLTKDSPPGAKRRWRLYSVKLEKRDGTEYDEWLSLGFDDPGVKEGDYIQVQAEQENGRWKADIKTLQKSKNPPARASKGGGSNASAPTQPSASGGSSSRYGDGTGVQNRTNPEDAKRMTYANARTAAIELIAVLLEHKALPTSAAQTKAGEAKRFDEIGASVDKLTVKFYNDSLSLRLLETVADTVPEKGSDGPLPDSAEDTSDGESTEPNDSQTEDDEGFDK
jgi:hypothetical protein